MTTTQSQERALLAEARKALVSLNGCYPLPHSSSRHKEKLRDLLERIDALLSSPSAAPAGVRLNQCDGCARGLPLVNGIHRGKGNDIIGCTADRYAPPPAPAAAQEDAAMLDALEAADVHAALSIITKGDGDFAVYLGRGKYARRVDLRREQLHAKQREMGRKA